MFGIDMRVGLTTRFPSDSVDNINTEDELEIFLNNINEEDENEGVDEKNNVQVVNENCCSKASKDEGLCDLICSRQKSIENNRKKSEICLLNQAEKMKFRSIHKFPPANIGDSVRVSLPDVDRGRADPRNIIFAVVSIEDGQYYKLGNKYGTLPQLYTRNQFSVCPLALIPLDEVVHVEKSLREIASQMSDGGGQGYKRCSCKGKCDTNRCKCKASSILCNSKCHGSMPCNNKG
uniref:KRAB-A domain-containing protein 2 n=1 Tax=Schizaphis graminum TaxID=13262 RepID=A0A2S2NJR4_SCHGA